MPQPFLERGYAPLRIEYDDVEAEIEGAWPAGLIGRFYRIGPNPQFEPRGAYNPLMGDGMVHRFDVRDGRVRYRNRWVRTLQWRMDRAAGRALFATSNNPGEMDPSVVGLQTDGVANTNLVWHGGMLLALEEGHPPFAIDPDTLATHGPHLFAGKLARNMTAHPKIDPGSGEMWLFANFERPRAGRELALYRAEREGTMSRRQIVETPFAALAHDMALTAHYAIVPICPVTVSMKRLMGGGPLIAWEPQLGTHLAVLRRADGAVRWFAGAPQMAWHVLNAFNEQGQIVVDVCAQDAAAFPAADGAPPDRTQLTQRLTRWTMDWDRPGAFETRRLVGERCEYPRIDERRTGRAYRFGYVACHGGPGSDDIFHRGLGVFDHETGAIVTCYAGADQAVAEPVFAPRGANEGDGWLLTNIYDEARDASRLALFDAENLAAGPIASARLPHRVPVGFHGAWIAA